MGKLTDAQNQVTLRKALMGVNSRNWGSVLVV